MMPSQNRTAIKLKKRKDVEEIADKQGLTADAMNKKITSL